MPRGRLGLRAIGPELGHDPPEVGPLDDVGRVGRAGRRVDRMARPVVRAQAVAAAGAGRDVDGRWVRRIEQAAVPDDLDELVLQLLVGGRVAEPRRRARIDRCSVGPSRGQRKTRHVSPLRANGLLDTVGHGDPVLGNHVGDLEWLPPIRVGHVTARSAIDDQRLIDRLVVGGRVSTRLVRTIRFARSEDRVRDPVADGCRRVAQRQRGTERVAQAVHDVGEFGQRRIATDRLDESRAEDLVGGVADGFAAGSLDVGGGVLLRHEDATGGRVVGSPGVPHGRRKVKQVPRVERRVGQRPADGVEERLVPAPRD